MSVGLDDPLPRERPLEEDRQAAVRPEGVAADAFVRVFRVPPEQAGKRVDVFLSTQLRNTSRTRAKLIAEKGAFTLDGRPLRASDRLRSEDRIAIWRAPIEETDEAPDLPILYEDEYIVVIDKPPLVAVHPTARHHKVTVIKLMQAERPNQFLSLVHRLDRETSGVLILAKSRAADRAFKRLIEDRSRSETGQLSRSKAPPLRKVYQCITWGSPVDGIIDKPLELDPDNPLRVKMRVARDGEGLEARTRVAVVERTERYALVQCELLTGRQHQIRIHLAAVGSAIVGDKLYGPDDRMLARSADGELTDADRLRLELPRHALHAHRYTLPHAITGETLELVAPLPADLRAFWELKRAPRARVDGAPHQR